jgi:hypothetical protein
MHKMTAYSRTGLPFAPFLRIAASFGVGIRQANAAVSTCPALLVAVALLDRLDRWGPQVVEILLASDIFRVQRRFALALSFLCRVHATGRSGPSLGGLQNATLPRVGSSRMVARGRGAENGHTLFSCWMLRRNTCRGGHRDGKGMGERSLRYGYVAA